MFNFVPFKLLINVHSKLSKATTFGKSCPGQNQFLFSKKIIGSIHIKERKSKISPSSKFVMLTGVFRKRSLRGNRSGYLRMKWVVWLKCIITFDNSHTFIKFTFSSSTFQMFEASLFDSTLRSWRYPQLLSLGEKTNRIDFPSNIGKQSHQLFLSSIMDGMATDCKNKDWCEDTLTSIWIRSTIWNVF